LEAGPIKLFGELAEKLLDGSADDDIHGQFVLEDNLN
jgi:hypothetical protein